MFIYNCFYAKEPSVYLQLFPSKARRDTWLEQFCTSETDIKSYHTITSVMEVEEPFCPGFDH